MARFDRGFPDALLEPLVREASQSRALLARTDAERSIYLQTSFEIRVHNGPITRDAVTASVMGEGSGQWQHQIGQPTRQNQMENVPEREAVAALITEPRRLEEEGRMILAVESGPRVQLIERSINWCDKNVTEDLPVRFLTFTAPQVDIFWFLDPESPRLLVVFGPTNFLKDYGENLLEIDNALPEIAKLPYLAGLRLSSENGLRHPPPVGGIEG